MILTNNHQRWSNDLQLILGYSDIFLLFIITIFNLGFAHLTGRPSILLLPFRNKIVLSIEGEREEEQAL